MPLVCYPRLRNATPEQRERWTLYSGGYGIHREEMDEDLSIKGMQRQRWALPL